MSTFFIYLTVTIKFGDACHVFMYIIIIIIIIIIYVYYYSKVQDYF